VTRPEPRPDLRAPRNEPMLPRPPLRPADSPSAVKAPLVRAPEPVVPASPPPPPPQDLATADQNLAEMAKRLEAALRRPADDSKPEAAPPVVPEPPGRARSGEISAVPAPHSEPSVAPPVAPPGPKSGFEHLEDEMASLLGRPKSPS
jgi:hypothetical protein